jgi:hypothetical protein
MRKRKERRSRERIERVSQPLFIHLVPLLAIVPILIALLLALRYASPITMVAVTMSTSPVYFIALMHAVYAWAPTLPLMVSVLLVRMRLLPLLLPLLLVRSVSRYRIHC